MLCDSALPCITGVAPDPPTVAIHCLATCIILKDKAVRQRRRLLQMKSSVRKKETRSLHQSRSEKPIETTVWIGRHLACVEHDPSRQAEPSAGVTNARADARTAALLSSQG